MLSNLHDWIYDDDGRYAVYIILRTLLIGSVLATAIWWILTLLFAATFPDMEGLFKL